MILALIILAALAVTAFIYSVISLKLLKTTKYEFNSERIPDSLNGKKAALISDLHCCHFGPDNSRLFDRLKKENPDYILITGDIINGVKANEIKFTEDFLSELSKLKIPTYYCLGNHESKLAVHDRPAYVKNILLIRKYCSLLINSTVYLDDEQTLAVSGIKNPLSLYHGKYNGERVGRIVDKALSTVRYSNSSIQNNDCFRILLAHDPYYFKSYAEKDIDLIVSGHVHGGIVRLPFIGGFISPRIKFFPKYDKGVFKENGSTMILSAGLGWHNLPIRFLNTPELVIISFTKK
ncbi:MAG: metallophosphoesterase [Lachnospiraceae bacterium]|nr:metallophosphoesterase [Lachnospiraceae bacterium]